MRPLSTTQSGIAESTANPGSVADLCDFIARHPGLFVITGAGISHASGIPTYRDEIGTWKSNTPIQHGEFMTDIGKRRRYWARSFRGWPKVDSAAPNAAHRALAELEANGYIETLVTQNIDRLHQKAGHRNVVDLHGRLDEVLCMDCGAHEPRAVIQDRLASLNPHFTETQEQRLALQPDGDADVSQELVDGVVVPECERCGGLLKPDVVFYGGSVPKEQVASLYERLEQASAVLVVGSSLMVYSSFRFCKHASDIGMPIACINKGLTRADALYRLKVIADCGSALERVVQALPPLP